MECYGFIDFEQEKLVLFVPRLNNLMKVWMVVMTKEDYTAKYGGLEVHYMDDLEAYLQTHCGPETNTTLYVNRGINSDSKL